MENWNVDIVIPAKKTMSQCHFEPATSSAESAIDEESYSAISGYLKISRFARNDIPKKTYSKVSLRVGSIGR